jgi:hypothetical protein
VFLCVDIGGGTTDISIWAKTRYVFQSSIHFASRAMFVAPLKRLLESKSVLDKVRTDADEDGIHTMLEYGGAASKDRIQFFIETVLFEYYEKFKNRLNALEGEDKDAYKNFKYRVFIAYTGLVYYLANIISVLLQSGEIDNDITDVVFGLSGKGAKLTDWINVHCQTIYNEAEKFIKEKSGIAIHLKDEFAADSAKTETAVGMICNLDGSGKQKNKTDEADPFVFLGCAIEATQGGTTKKYAKNEFANVYTGPLSKPKSLSVNIDQSLPEFDEFICFFNNIAAKTRNDMPPIDTQWFDKKKKSLWNQIKTEFENIFGAGRFDPPFIVMLGVFLKEYGNE